MIKYLFVFLIVVPQMLFGQSDVFKDILDFHHQVPFPIEMAEMVTQEYKLVLNEVQEADTTINLFGQDCKMYLNTIKFTTYGDYTMESKTYDENGEPYLFYKAKYDEEGRILEEYSDFKKNEMEYLSYYKSFEYDLNGTIRRVYSRMCDSCSINAYVEVDKDRNGNFSKIKMYDPNVGTNIYVGTPMGDKIRFIEEVKPEGLLLERLLKFGTKMEDLDIKFVDIEKHDDNSSTYTYGTIEPNSKKENITAIKRRDSKHFEEYVAIFEEGVKTSEFELVFNEKGNLIKTKDLMRNSEFNQVVNNNGDFVTKFHPSFTEHFEYDERGYNIRSYKRALNANYVIDYVVRSIKYKN